MAGAQRRIVRIIVGGRVQGVGYRAHIAREAERHGLAGWVRNRRDGTVETVVAGPPGAVETMASACKRGPMFGRVDACRIEEADEAALQEAGAEQGFFVAKTK